MTYILFILGFILVVKGADYLISGASGFSKQFGINPLFIGLTVVAFGTSLPEFVVSLIDAINGSEGIGIGNVIGSNIANIALILGFVSILKPIKVQERVFKRDLPITFVVSLIFYLMMLDGVISAIDGSILVMIFIGYLTYVYRKARSGEEEFEEEEDIEKDSFKNSLKTIGGLAALFYGAKLLIDNASIIAASFGISELVIGLTIVAIGTSLPELVTTMQALRKDEDDIGVGGIVGSNIFNVLFVIGIISIIKPFHVDTTNITIFGPFMLFITLLLYPLSIKGKILTRRSGIIFFSLYLLYTFYSFIGK